MPARSSAAAFFVFDPTLVPEGAHPSEEEQADAKILYYSPSCALAEEKRSQAGLIEGLIAFTSMFSGGSGPLQNLRTRQYAFGVLEAEPHTWMVLVMRNPPAGADGSRTPTDSQYDEESLSDSTVTAILKNCYGVFRLLHGKIQHFVKEHSVHKLFDVLEDFVPAYLETIDASDLGIFHEINGLHYGPVERNTCVSIYCFLDKMQENFPSIRHSALLYNAHLIYSSFSLDDMRVLYSYLVAFNGAVSNQKLNKVPFGRIPTAASQPGGGSSSFGRSLLLTEEEDFLFGISRRPGVSAAASIFVPAVYLTEGGGGQLVCLTHNGVMLVLIFDMSTQLDARTLEAVRAKASVATGDGLSLAELRPLIAAQYAQVMEHSDDYRFVYYNHTNHALRLSNQPGSSRSLLGGSKGPSGPIPKAAERAALCPIRAALADPQLRCREVSWKSVDKGWICAKRWREREFYLLLDGTSMSLSTCQEECARFASIHFSNIFMM